MTPHKAIEALKELKPGSRWEIEMHLVHRPHDGLVEYWTITRNDYVDVDREWWDGSTLDEAMEKVLESLKV